MNIVTKAITGEEKSFSSKEYKIISQFYKAFNTQDIALMKENWCMENGIMDNPLGGILRGWEEISPVYEKIFFGKAKVYVEFYDYTLQKSGDMFFVAGRERGYIEKNGIKLDLAIRTSRIYTLENNQYKQVHHHGSIVDAKLLDTYQNFVMA